MEQVEEDCCIMTLTLPFKGRNTSAF